MPENVYWLSQAFSDIYTFCSPEKQQPWSLFRQICAALSWRYLPRSPFEGEIPCIGVVGGPCDSRRQDLVIPILVFSLLYWFVSQYSELSLVLLKHIHRYLLNACPFLCSLPFFTYADLVNLRMCSSRLIKALK